MRSAHITKIKEKVAPVGIVDFDNSLSRRSGDIALEYFKKHSSVENYTKEEYLADVKNAVGEARALHHLKESNKKEPLKKNINEIVKHVSGLINALKEMENNSYTLGILRQEIDKNSDVLGYQVYSKFLTPGEYADCELGVVLPLLKDAQVIINCAAELKTKDWQSLLCHQLVVIHKKLTGNYPPKTSRSSIKYIATSFNQFVNEISMVEFRNGTSEKHVKEALDNIVQ